MASSTCLTCFAQVPPPALPKSVVHSCCARPVCSTCLLAMPRLATFCPFCEGVDHALRRGPRRDVTRAGQVVFDMDSAMEEPGCEDVGAPPAYQASSDGAFVLGEEDGEGQRTPQLLQTSRLGVKQGPAHGLIDRSKAATVSNPSTTCMETMTASLRKSLSGSAGEAGEGSASRPAHSAVPSMGSGALKPTGREMQAGSGLTRQYWLRPSDTLTSLSLRFKVNASTLCKLNDLPLSTATTTPHLVHTRQYLLIPETAILSALSTQSDVDGLESALKGPEAQSRKLKIQRARREAQLKFRTTVAKSDSMTRDRGRDEEATVCDDRAAKAYIALMEVELKCIDFGDGLHDDTEDDRIEEQDAAVEASRRERFNVIVRQAVCRWEMDSDWERQQRALGLTPGPTRIAEPSRKGTGAGASTSWLTQLTGTSHSERRPSRVGWMEKAR